MIQIKTLPVKSVEKTRQLHEPLIVITRLARLKTKSPVTGLPSAVAERLTVLLARQHEQPKAGTVLKAPALRSHDPELVLGILPEPTSTFELLGFAKKLLAEALSHRDERLGVTWLGANGVDKMAFALGAALSARLFKRPVFGKKAEKVKTHAVKLVEIFHPGAQVRKEFERGYVYGEGTNLVRHLAYLPPNILNSKGYGEEIKRVSKEHGLKVKFHSRAELTKLGAGAFLAVDQGDPESQGGIYEVSYEPKGKSVKDHVALVGKGMCFDTGGYDVKTGGNMVTMKGDMQGSAVALATLAVASKLKLKTPLRAYLAVTENHISPRSYKPDDVVTALNGVSIEIINTDAEGRMVLADALALASRAKPKLIVDFATLTGSAVRAIGSHYGVAFSRPETLHTRILKVAEKSGERMWTFPIVQSYESMLESQVADTKQCVKGGSPDHIMAALFLSKFVDDKIPWIHVDLSASENEGGLAHTDTVFTGFGVLWATDLLQST